ncbi:CRISPR locus-related DNA-binding protein, partial [Patescibacteria group bacterium]|nr:CRISPR locus-related DNA-binding protein [Patescibacteria group bacterium]
IAKIKTVFVDSANVLGTVRTVAELIDKETAEGKKVVMNASGGFKLLGHAMLYASFARASKIDKIVCSAMKDARLVELPKLSFGLSDAKLGLLKKLEKRNGRSVDEMAEALGKSRAMIYQHLKELKEEGYVDKEFNITETGRMALL